MHWLSPLLYVEAKFGSKKKDKKRLTSIDIQFSEQPGTLFLTTKGMKKFWNS
jgi:hypothetical protein